MFPSNYVLIKLFLLILFFLPKSNSQIKNNIFLPNISQCFEIVNSTTLLKKSFYYLNSAIKEQCTKLALSYKYKEDIFFPKYFHKCFPLCNSCSEYSTKKTNMKCLSCLNGFQLKQGNCYLNNKYNPQKRKKELSTIFNTLNINPNITSNDIIKKYIDGEEYIFISNINNKKIKKRKLYATDDYDDVNNAIFNREDQSSLSNDKSDISYNFHIELSPYYFLAQRCISKGKYFIENKLCVDQCQQNLENHFGYQDIKIKIGPNDEVTVCDCEFRCCIKKMNNLYKSLDRGFIDGSYPFFRKQSNGRCLMYNSSYNEAIKLDQYLLAQDFVPCFFPIYDDNNEIEFYISGYNKTIIGNGCENLCPIDNKEEYYYYNPDNSGCYKCPAHCIECNDIPTQANGHCIKCEEYYNGIVDGFCVHLCPEGYGEKNGIKYICEKCDDDEIKFDNQCLPDLGSNHNYGTVDNPSYPDDSNSKLFHRCLEYVEFRKYVYNPDSTVCPYIRCPDPFYNGANGICENCPDGCYTCSNSGIDCIECDKNYALEDGFCRPCPYIDDSGVIATCATKCENKYLYNN